MSTDTLRITLESKAFAADRLEIVKVSGVEAMNRLFDFSVDALSNDRDNPPPESMVGATTTLVIESLASDGTSSVVRRVHGMIASVEDRFRDETDRRSFRLRLVPHALTLTLVESQDICSGSVPDIIRTKLNAVGMGDNEVDFRLAETYPSREFVVQYKETDYAFVSRLAEHVGISSYLVHGDDQAKLILTDHRDGFTAHDDGKAVPFRPRGEVRDVFELVARRNLVPAYYSVRDYNYRTPLVELTGESELAQGFAGGVIEFGSHHKTPEEATWLARVRAEERGSNAIVYTGRSAVPTFAPGMRVTISDHPDLGTLEVLLTEVTHEAARPVAGQSEPTSSYYTNTFRAVPADRTFRPPRTTPKPRIAGLVTAVVDAGPGAQPGRYAKIDEQGRYFIRFLFDTAGPERRVSRPVRMLQNHVGENYGTHFPLKPGVEVCVGFIDGDPDRPMIVGAVPNPTKPSPVTNADPGVHRIRTSTGITVDMGE